MSRDDIIKYTGKLVRKLIDINNQTNNKTTIEELPFGVVKCGEKVIALSNDDRANVGEPTMRGEIFTVASYNKGAYRFEERGSYYDPYLGEEATPWYSTKDFLPLNDESRSIVRDLDAIAKAHREMFQSFASFAIPNYCPKTKLTMFSKKEEYERLIEEYRILISDFSKAADTWKKDDKLLQVLRSNPYLPDNENTLVDYERPLRYASNRVVEEIHKYYDSVFSKVINPQKEHLPVFICEAFSRQIGRMCDDVCEQYKINILHYMENPSGKGNRNDSNE